jgi:hypothetical protein
VSRRSGLADVPAEGRAGSLSQVEALDLLGLVAERLAPGARPATGEAGGAGSEWLIRSVLDAARTGDPDLDDRAAGAICDPMADREVERILWSSALVRGREPGREVYEEVVVLGAASAGMWRRLEFVARRRISTPVLTVLAGRRAHLWAMGNGRDGDVGALLGPGGPFPAADGWVAPARLIDRWDRSAHADGWRLAAELFTDESSLALALIDRMWPDAMSARIGTTVLPDGREVVGRVTLAAGGYLEREGVVPDLARVRVLDAPPVRRSNGPSRPTTASTLSEWIARGVGSTGGRRRVLVVTGQPHLARVERTLEALGASARLDADLEVAGCSARPPVRTAVLLRELVLMVAEARSRAGRA